MAQWVLDIILLILVVGASAFVIWVLEEIFCTLVDIYNYFTGIRWFYKWAINNKYDVKANGKLDYDVMLIIGKEYRSKIKYGGYK